MSFIFKLEAAMAEHGILIKGSINPNSDRFQRFKSRNGGKGRDLFVKLLDGGAIFGDWHHPERWVTWWEESYSSLMPQKQLQRKTTLELLKQKENLLQQATRKRIQLLWQHESLVDASLDHPYVKLKRIIPYYAKQCRSWLILPVRDISQNLISLQYISSDCKRKRFKKNGICRGGMMLLGEECHLGGLGTIRICEGYATACSIYEAVGPPVICAFSASNLEAVAVAIRQKYSKMVIFICADNDCDKKENLGVNQALIAAQASNAFIVVPQLKTNAKCDWNDLFCLEGVEIVVNQLTILGI